jgi:hypothetical protein
MRARVETRRLRWVLSAVPFALTFGVFALAVAGLWVAYVIGDAAGACCDGLRAWVETR